MSRHTLHQRLVAAVSLSPSRHLCKSDWAVSVPSAVLVDQASAPLPLVGAVSQHTGSMLPQLAGAQGVSQKCAKVPLHLWPYLLLKTQVVVDGRWELAGLVKTGAEQTGNLLDDRVGGQESVVGLRCRQKHTVAGAHSESEKRGLLVSEDGREACVPAACKKSG